jgi:hypothetical protein
MSKLLAASVLLMALVRPALAELCPLEDALHRLESTNAELKADLIEKQRPLLRELDELSSQAKNQNADRRPPSDEVDRLQHLRSDLIKLQMTYATNSGYLRDARAIAKTADIAYQLRNGRVIESNSPDQFYSKVAFLALVSAGSGDIGDLASVAEGECSIDAGLTARERLELKSANTKATVAAVQELDGISRRYGLKSDSVNWIERIPDSQTKKHARTLAAATKDMEAVITYIKMMESLRGINRTALMMLDVNQDDVNQSTSEEELSKRFGQRWDALVKASGDEKLVTYDRILAMIAQQIASDSLEATPRLESAAKQTR